MASGCTSGAGSAGTGGGGDSSESQHDTDQQGEDTDSPPAVRRRTASNANGGRSSRPHSDLINQILIDKFKVRYKYIIIYRVYQKSWYKTLNFELVKKKIFGNFFDTPN